MLVSLAGAMSTGELGISLSRMIREDKVHAISCSGSNLEEDVFNLLGHDDYEVIPDWKALSAADEADLYGRGLNRVTDTCISEDVMRHLARRLIDAWVSACAEEERRIVVEYLFEVICSGEPNPHYRSDPRNSWLISAMEKGIPVYSPGWEDSTTGNMLAVNMMMGRVPHHQYCRTGTE